MTSVKIPSNDAIILWSKKIWSCIVVSQPSLSSYALNLDIFYRYDLLLLQNLLWLSSFSAAMDENKPLHVGSVTMFSLYFK